MLRDIEAAKALFEKVGLFKAPELLEKYVIASEVTVEVLDLFLSRVFGTERAWISRESGDLKALWESLGCCSWSEGKGAASGDLSARADEQMEGLRVKVQDLERQLCAVQRHLQMQGEVSRLAVKKALFEQKKSLESAESRKEEGHRTEIDRLQQEIASLKSKNKKLSEDRKNLESEKSDQEQKQRTEIDRLQQEIESLKSKNKKLSEEKRNLKNLKDFARKMYESIDSIVREFPAKVKELQGVDPKSDLCKITQDLCKKILNNIPIRDASYGQNHWACGYVSGQFQKE